MTRTERLKLAKAARELAMECVAGTAPKFDGTLYYFGKKPACALAHVEKRAGAPMRSICNMYLDEFPYFEHSNLVSEALYPGDEEMPDGAVVFPLLGLADELEEES